MIAHRDMSFNSLYAQQESEMNRIKFVLLIYYWILRAQLRAWIELAGWIYARH